VLAESAAVPWHRRGRRGRGCRPGVGRALRSSPPTSSARISSSRCSAPSSPVAVTLVGPRRSRSSVDDRSPSGTTSRPSSRARCPESGTAARAAQSRVAAWPRTEATSRANTVGPGSSTFASSSRAVARSKSTPGRSLASRVRASSQRPGPAVPLGRRSRGSRRRVGSRRRAACLCRRGRRTA